MAQGVLNKDPTVRLYGAKAPRKYIYHPKQQNLWLIAQIFVKEYTQCTWLIHRHTMSVNPLSGESTCQGNCTHTCYIINRMLLDLKKATKYKLLKEVTGTILSLLVSNKKSPCEKMLNHPTRTSFIKLYVMEQ